MGLSAALLASCFLMTAHTDVSKYHISYLMQRKKITEAVDLYSEYRKELGRHDFEVLQQLAMILLDEGARSNDQEEQFLSIYGSSIAGILSPIDILESGVLSTHPETQLASIRSLARLQDDRSEELLNRAMASPFLYARMEAAYSLAIRKARTAVGQIEALMYRLPHEMHAFFPEFFALIGTNDAMLVLRHLMDDQLVHVKIEAILSAARYERDDVLPIIRTIATHSNPAELEACAFALGRLKDSKSIPKLQKMTSSTFPQVQVAAWRALHDLGDAKAQKALEELAIKGNLFAISVLGTMPGSEGTLVALLDASSDQVWINAAVALLKLRDPRCVESIFSLLVRDGRDMGIEPHFSIGSSLIAWRQVPMAKQKAVEGLYDLRAVSLTIRENLLQECLELPEKEFLRIAEGIFQSRQTELIPLLVSLLENLATKETIELLQKKAATAGAPLIRTYCSLALYRLNKAGPYEEHLRTWVRSLQSKELIRFRPVVMRQRHLDGASFEITPEESSRLLIEAYSALAKKHETESIELLLQGIKDGHPKNRYVLAGLLLHSIQ